MPTKEEMKDTIAKLNDEIDRLISNVKPEEASVRLRWDHAVSTDHGQAASIYGIKLTLDDNGRYYADVKYSRAEVELSRAGKAFVICEDEDEDADADLV